MINKQRNHAILGLNVHNSWIDVSGRFMSLDCACQNLGPKTPNVPFPQGQGSCQGNHGRCHAGPSLVVHASHVLVKGVRCLFQEGAEGEGGGLSLLETKVSSQQNQNEIGGGRGVVLKKKEAVWRQTKRICLADGNKPILHRCVARLEEWKAFVKLCHRNAFHLNALNSATHKNQFKHK